MAQMAEDAIASIQAKGFKQVDLFGFSMGGKVVQDIVMKQPQLVHKLMLAGTGPAGGEGRSTVAGVTFHNILRGLFAGAERDAVPVLHPHARGHTGRPGVPGAPAQQPVGH